MLDLFPDYEYDELVRDIEHIVSFLPIDVWVEEMVLWIKPTSREYVEDDGHIAALAEYLRMSKRSISEIREVEGKLLEVTSQCRMPVYGRQQVSEYLDALTGEMAMQDAFPNRAPSWRLYYIDPSDPRSTT